uniref:Uncharacterized protein n=1 Tax=viral metagenome TaxID=1070528 RepID=A0A6C0C9T4_9ZZZZ
MISNLLATQFSPATLNDQIFGPSNLLATQFLPAILNDQLFKSPGNAILASNIE